MPPRISLPRLPVTARQAPSSILASFTPSSSTILQQHRHASILSSLSDIPTAYNKRIRRGRGPASGKGKTSGRGHGGQKQHGKVPAGFNGGQTPDIVVSGERGFDNQFSLDMAKLNLDRIQSWIDQGRIDPTKPITVKEIKATRLVHGIKDGVKLLARNATDLRTPIHITVSRASSAAIAAIEALGGTVQTRYYTRSSLRRIFARETHPTLSLLSQPPLPLSAASTSPSPTTSDPEAPAPSASTSLQTPSDAAVRHRDVWSSPGEAAHAALLGAIRSYKYRLPDPASRKDLEYYRDPAHRGYLSYQLSEGQGPSLFFKSPKETEMGGVGGGKRKVKGGSGKRSAENRIWS